MPGSQLATFFPPVFTPSRPIKPKVVAARMARRGVLKKGACRENRNFDFGAGRVHGRWMSDE
jgi:hypothetical protein